ncbi:MAG: HlyD family efflux transporter periplasmic adaptor subunit [Patescibacteria group bacterium]|nr:HlyD family efflux transporter periplasmic adaptor subunit [Patescibacteria group bacterium]
MNEPTNRQLEKEIIAEEKQIQNLNRRVMMITAAFVLVVGAAIAGGVYWLIAKSHVSIDNSLVSAPQIDLAPQGAGVLEVAYVRPGDLIDANTVVARVGDELIKSKVAGLVIAVQNEIGKLFNPGQAVVSMIDPAALRVVGQLDENKGLKDVRVGDPATFTVDTFGSKQYYGVVDEISPTARSGDVVFNISDQRQTQSFDVKVRFDAGAYPELKNGMSAKISITTE